LPADRLLDVRERLLGIPLVVVEHEIDGMTARRQREALAHLAAGEPGALECYARLFGEVREGDGVAALLGHERARARQQQEQAPPEADPEKESPAPPAGRRRAQRAIHGESPSGCPRSRRSCRSARPPWARSC